MRNTLLILAIGLLAPVVADAQVSARLFRYPDVSQTQIVFAYGGDLWIADKEGGQAVKLSSPPGGESFPRFSPDGSTVAFSGNYDGNTDIYTIPSGGGIPNRITHHGMTERVQDWYPDGNSILFSSMSESGKQRFSQFYKVGAEGGLPDKLPVAYGEFGSLSEDGKKFAFTDRSRIFRTWKRYRGGTAADIWIFDLETLESKNITDNTANDELPMWCGDKIYYLSDAGTNQRFNIWSHDLKSGKNKQVTDFRDDDVHFPSHGPEEIVFEAGGKLYLLSLADESIKEVEIEVVTDLMSVKPSRESAKDYVQNIGISPDGNRAIIEARGDVFSLPGSKGTVRNLTRTPGVAERYPAWSPNGRYVAYWSDKTGEYELTLSDMTKGGEETTISSLGPGFRYRIYWSPDNEKIAYVDQAMNIHVFDVDARTDKVIDQDIVLFEGGLRNWRPSWSNDGTWLAYSKTLGNGNSAVFIYNTDNGELTQATNGFYSDMNPTFEPEGKYLYVLTNRSFQPVYSDFDNSWSYPNATQLALITLRDDVESPLHAENDTVAIAMDDEKEDEEAEEEKEENGSDSDDEEAEEEEEETLKIDFDGFERRLVVLPPEAGNIGRLTGVEGKVVFIRFPNSGSGDDNFDLKYFDLKEREEKTIISGIFGYAVSADGKKVLVRKGSSYGIIDFGADKKLDDKLALNDMQNDRRSPRRVEADIQGCMEISARLFL